MEREAELLEVPYFHMVFTLPHELNILAVQNPKEFYNALFKASWQTIQTFAADPAHLGAKTSVTAVLHTWGQQLSLHPHLHCIVPGGGINTKGAWVFPKKYSKNKRKVKYLFPKRALSKVYRAKFMAALREEIAIPQNIAAAVMTKNWVVYAKRPFLGPKAVMEYLGRYTHKIAISNHRIIDVSDGKISFKYKDYRKAGSQKIMVLSAHEFIRRFALHVLPKGFRKMRHYGMLASRNKATDLNKAKAFFNLELWVKQKISWEQIAKVKLKINPNLCQICKTETMVVVENIEPCRGPPVFNNKAIMPNYEF